MRDNVTVASEWKENVRMSRPTFIELCEGLMSLLETQMALTLYFMSGKFQMLSEFLGHQFSLS